MRPLNYNTEQAGDDSPIINISASKASELAINIYKLKAPEIHSSIMHL